MKFDFFRDFLLVSLCESLVDRKVAQGSASKRFWSYRLIRNYEYSSYNLFFVSLSVKFILLERFVIGGVLWFVWYLLKIYIHTCIYIYIYICVCVCVCVCVWRNIIPRAKQVLNTFKLRMLNARLYIFRYIHFICSCYEQHFSWYQSPDEGY